MKLEVIQNYRHELSNYSFRIPSSEEVSIINLVTKNKQENLRTCQISKNVAGEYSFDEEILSLMNYTYQEFFDGEEKILEIFCFDREVSIQIFCKNQVNLFAAIQAKNFELTSEGHIFFGATVIVANSLTVKAKDLCFHDVVKCREMVIDTQSTLILQSTCKAQKVKWVATKIIQEKACQLGAANISCKTYLQNEQAPIVSRHLILAADYFQSCANIKVLESAFIASIVLLLGSKEFPVYWELSSLHHLHFHSADIQVQGHIKIIPLAGHTGKFVVDDSLNINKTAHLEINQSLCHVGDFECAGQLDLQSAFLKVKNFKQFGQFKALDAELYVDEFFFQDNDGKTLIQNSNLYLTDLLVGSGEFQSLLNSKIMIENQFTSDESSIVCLERTKVLVQDRMFISGDLMVEYTQISADQFKSFQYLKASMMVLSTSSAYIYGNSSIIDCELNVKDLVLFDDSHLYCSDLISQNIFLTLENSTIEKCSFEGEKIAVVASSLGASFRNECYLVAKHFYFENPIYIQDSTLFAIDDEDSQHVIAGEFVLDKSFFFSHSKLAHTHSFSLLNGAALFGEEVDSAGNIITKQAMLEVKRIKQTSSLISNHSSIQIEEGIVSNHQILLEECSRLMTKKVLLSSLGSLKLLSNSQLFSSESITLDKGSQLQVEEAMVATKKMHVGGTVQLLQSLIDVEELQIYAQFEAKQSSALRVHEKMLIAEGSLLNGEDSCVQVKSFKNWGYTYLTDSSLQVEMDVELDQKSRTLLMGQSGISAENIVSNGKLYIDKTSTRYSKTMPSIVAKNRLTIKENSGIYGNGLSIQAHTLHNRGEILMTESLIAKGKWLTNLGEISASDSRFGFDYLTFNMGSISADQMLINSNFFNLFGGVYARKNLSASGLFNLNIGLVSANNYYNNALFSLNGGLIAPNLAAEVLDIFSFNNTIGLLANNINILAPSSAQGIGLLTSTINVGSTLLSIYQNSNELTWDKLSSLTLYDLYPILGKLKNYYSLGQSVYSNISGLSFDANSWEQTLNNYQNQPQKIFDVAKKTFQEANWNQIAYSSLGFMFGTYSDNSLVHINTGVSIMPNTTQWNFADYNYGIEKSLLTHSKMTSYFVNDGYSGGSETTIMFDEMKNNGKLEGQFKLVMKGRKAENLGTIEGINAILDMQELQQKGSLNLKKALVKVATFEDSENATTSLEESMLEGQTLDQHGHFKFNKVSIREKQHYHAEHTAQSQMDNIYIETNDFNYDGQLDYQHQCTVVADHIILGEHSKINGARTDKDKLFKDKPPAEGKAGGEQDGTPAPAGEKKTPPQPEKEFCPEHILSLYAKKTELKGCLTGGDYTQIASNPNAKPGEPNFSADELLVEDSAHIDLDYGSIQAINMHTTGFAHFDHFNFKVGHHEISDQASFSFNNGYYEGDYLSNSADFSAKDSYFKVGHLLFNKDATERVYNTFFESKQVIDESHLYSSGQVVFSTDDYQHRGDIHNQESPDSGKKNQFYVKTKTAQLDGRSDLDNVFYDIENFKDAKDFACGAGKYSLYSASQSFGLSTTGKLDLSQEIYRNCHMYLQADTITMTKAYKKQYDLTLVSRLGDVELLADVHANNFYVQSAGKILTNKRLEATNTLAFEAKSAVENYGGFINGKTVSIVGSEIKNITAGSNAAKNGTPISVGGAGVINASEHLYLTAILGNIENHGGLIRAGIYAQLVAKGDVLNLCNTRTYQGQFDTVKEFDPGVIQGGTGEGKEKIGLYIKADGQVIGDASDFVSNGTNYIQGVKGIHLGCQSHTYISNHYDEYGFAKFSHKEIIETHTNFKGCDVRSTDGRNILISDEGGISAQAANFISPGGTDIYAKKDVKLLSARYSDKHYEYQDSFWGAIKKKIDEDLQNSVPTFFCDNGLTRIKSAEGCVDARGAYFFGNGDLSIEAHGKILIGRDKLEQHRETSSRAVNWSIPGLSGVNALMNGGGVWSALTAEDATLAKLNSLMGSQSAAELLANASNMGVDLTNTTNSACRAIGSGQLTEELLSRYGLGGAKGFNPSATLGINHSDSSFHTQTLGKGGIERGGNVSLKSDTGIEVFNGAPIHAGKNLDLDAPEFIAHAAELHSHAKEHKEGLSFHFNLLNGVQSAHASASTRNQASTQYVYSDICSGGTTRVHHGDSAMELMELDGATIHAKNIEGAVDKLVITDKQDTRQASSKSMSMGTNGAFSVSASESGEQVTNHHSGIHTTDDLNTPEHHFEVNDTVMTGGEITSDGVNHFQTKTLESHELHDSKYQVGIGYSGHLPHADTHHHEPHNAPGEKVIGTAGHVKVDFVHYEASNSSVLFGAQGNDFHVDEYLGDEVHTSSANGRTVESNIREHINYDVPVAHSENFEMFSTNVKRFFDKVAPPVATQPEAVLGLPPRRPNDPQSKGTSISAGPHPHTAKDTIELALKNIHLDPKLASRVQQELKQYGQLSASTQNLLKHQIGEVLLKSLKAGSEYGWDKLTETALKDVLSRSDQWVSKIYLGRLGAVIQFEFNLLLSDAPSGSDKIKHAIAKTGTDIVVGMLLSQIPGAGWALTVADIMDSFYDTDHIQHLLELNGEINQSAIKAMQEGHYLQGIALADQSRGLLTAAGTMEMMHQLANATAPIVKKFEELMSSKPDEEQIRPASGF